ncbi:MAG: hypothetical protein ABI747_01270 [Candidatus Moraniibacteriota bacterium]
MRPQESVFSDLQRHIVQVNSYWVALWMQSACHMAGLLLGFRPRPKTR